MTLEQYKEYAEQVARRNKAIGHKDNDKHFTVFTAEDALGTLKNIGSPLLAAELPQISFVDGESDNIHTVMNGAFLILKKCKQGESVEIIKAYEEMYVVALDVFKKFLNDRRMALADGRALPEKLLHNLQVNSIRMVDVGPVFESYYGWRIDFPFQSEIISDLDVTKWIGETSYS